MGIKISALPSIAVPALTDIFPVVQAGVTYKETVQQLSDLIGGVVSGSILGTANQIIVTPGVGNVTLSTPQDIATTSDVTFGSVAFSPTTKGIVGTPTNNNAGAGFVGEYIESIVLSASAVSLTSGVTANVTSISLTTGDWDVFGNVWTKANAATTTSVLAVGISSTSATLPGAPGLGPTNLYQSDVAAGNNLVLPTGTGRFSLAVTTTIYLAAQAGFAVNTMGAYGIIGARRMR